MVDYYWFHSSDRPNIGSHRKESAIGDPSKLHSGIFAEYCNRHMWIVRCRKEKTWILVASNNREHHWYCEYLAFDFGRNNPGVWRKTWQRPFGHCYSRLHPPTRACWAVVVLGECRSLTLCGVESTKGRTCVCVDEILHIFYIFTNDVYVIKKFSFSYFSYPFI